MQRADNYPFKDKIAIVAEGCLPGAYLEPINVGNDNKKRNSLVPYIKEIFEEVHKCGFNAFISDDAVETAKFILDKTDGEPYALPAILRFSNGAMEPYRIIPAIDNFKDNARVIGYNYKDEPQFWAWGDALMEPQYDKGNEIFYSTSQWSFLTAWNAVCSELVPGSLGYWTLAVPVKKSVQEKNVLGTCKDYEQYLKTLDRLYKPPLWAYDVDPIQKKIENAGTKDNEKEKTLIEVQHAHFYNSFRMFRNQSVKTGNIFWAYAMVLDHSWYEKGESQYSVNLPTPTLGSLRFEIFSALACGAQGIVFYKLGSSLNLERNRIPLTPNEGQEPDYSSLPEGNFTVDAAFIGEDKGSSVFTLEVNDRLLGIIKSAITEVQKYNLVFARAYATNLWQYGSEYADGIPLLETNNTLEAGTSFGWIPERLALTVEAALDSPKNSRGVLVTRIVKGIRKYIVIVSHNPFFAQVLKIKFLYPQFKIKNPIIYSVTRPQLPQTYDWNTPAGTLIPKAANGYYTLPAGGYIILEEN